MEKSRIDTNKLTFLFSRYLRWGLGILFVAIGLYDGTDWPVTIFGTILFITGFLRPRRCNV
jgi:hypothetical protein